MEFLARFIEMKGLTKAPERKKKKKSSKWVLIEIIPKGKKANGL
jgi:hypothetical protein